MFVVPFLQVSESDLGFRDLPLATRLALVSEATCRKMRHLDVVRFPAATIHIQRLDLPV